MPEIKVVKCPRLNNHYSSESFFTADNIPSLEVIVKFSLNGDPVGIMCDFYDDGKCVVKENRGCIYREWKEI